MWESSQWRLPPEIALFFTLENRLLAQIRSKADSGVHKFLTLLFTTIHI